MPRREQNRVAMADRQDRSERAVQWAGLLLAVLAPVVLTVVLNLAGGPKLRDYAFLYLGVVAITGVTFGLWPSLISAVASFLLVDYYFVPPYYTLTIGDPQDMVNLVVLLAAAGLVGGLGSMRRRAQLRSEALAGQLGMANEELERLNREQGEAAKVALRLAVTEQQVRDLEESDRARRDFLANVSHDLRTPIATILTESTAVLEDQDLHRQARASLASIAGEAQRLNLVVADILDMARIEGDALELQLEPIPVGAAVEAAVERLGHVSPGREVSLPDDADTTMVLADWRRLGQVLDNLLVNANRAAPAGTRIEITVNNNDSDRMATIRVIDHGPGIPADLGDRVFERFVRGETRGEGTGLGLAIVKGLVEAHAGRVWLEPSKQGAVLAFSLPLAESAAD
jgi:K+-sensing histidine kinase KdpD